jgi:large subunit ribosomal protein L6
MVEKRIDILEGVNVTINGNNISAKGPKGTLNRDFSSPRFNGIVSMRKEENQIVINSINDRRKSSAVVGTVAAHVKNIFLGVSKGYNYKMKIHYVHFPITIEVKGKEVMIKNFLGERGVRKATIIGNTKIEVKKDDILIIGIDKENVSQTAANIEQACKIGGRDRRIFQDGIYMIGYGTD